MIRMMTGYELLRDKEIVLVEGDCSKDVLRILRSLNERYCSSGQSGLR